MTRSITLFRTTVLAGFAAGFWCAAQAQESSALSGVSQGLSVNLSGLENEQRLVSYTTRTELGGMPQQLNFEELAKELPDEFARYEREEFLEAFLAGYLPDNYAEEQNIQGLSGLSGLASALQDGSMSALAAEEALAFIAGTAQCQSLGGEVFPKDDQGNPRPQLVQSTMDLHFNVGALPGNKNFGRGQFDIHSLKILLCVVADTPADSFPIIVDRRWVLNVTDDKLEARTDVQFPPNDPAAPIFPFQLTAEGRGIELVSYYVSGVRQPRTDMIYKKSPHACIDIFFNFVPQQDAPVFISIPDNVVFCAGGACKDRPPYLDATR